MIEITLLVEHRIVRQFLFQIGRSNDPVPEQRSGVVAFPVVFVGMAHHDGDAGNFAGQIVQRPGTGIVKTVAQQQVFGRVTAQAEFGCQQQLCAPLSGLLGILQNLCGITRQIA